MHNRGEDPTVDCLRESNISPNGHDLTAVPELTEYEGKGPHGGLNLFMDAHRKSHMRQRLAKLSASV
jgi:hypothetical protein